MESFWKITSVTVNKEQSTWVCENPNRGTNKKTLDNTQVEDYSEEMNDVKEEDAEKSEVNEDPLCKNCELVFASKNQLEEHIAMEHQNECNICNKMFPSLKTLNSHKRIHNIKKEGHQDPDIHFPETEEEMYFSVGGERGKQAYDKHFFAFR